MDGTDGEREVGQGRTGPRLPQPGEAQPPVEHVPWGWKGPAAHPGSAPVPIREPAQTVVTVFGDVVRTGTWTPAQSTSAVQVFGDVKLDLRRVLRPGETLRLTFWSVFGDVRVAVPPGTVVDIQGVNVVGDVRHDVDASLVGIPDSGARVVITSNSLFGDVRVRTMPLDLPGKPPGGWRWLRKP